MNTREFLGEANVAEKILKDPVMVKKINLAWRHDHTLPPQIEAQLGPKPTAEEVIKAFSDVLDDTLRSSNWGDLSRDGKFDQWLTRLYADGKVDYEDINGEGGDALGQWKALSNRRLLDKDDQDFNKFKTLKQIQRIVAKKQYKDALEKIRTQERAAKMKKDAKGVVVYDDDKVRVVIPMNYGGCYVFAHDGGVIPTFCTSSSSGENWFQRYGSEGPIVSITNKKQPDGRNGKWQFHAPTGQIVDAEQNNRHDRAGNDEKFSELFPGLMRKIADGIKAHAEEIKEMSKPITPNQRGYDMDQQLADIKSKFPRSWASEDPEDAKKKEKEPEVQAGQQDDEDDFEALYRQRQQQAAGEVPASRGGRPQDIPQARQPEPPAPAVGGNDGPGVYRLSFGGRTVNHRFNSADDARQQVLARNPNIDINAVEITRIGD
jgi:hypothetical protein